MIMAWHQCLYTHIHIKKENSFGNTANAGSLENINAYNEIPTIVAFYSWCAARCRWLDVVHPGTETER